MSGGLSRPRLARAAGLLPPLALGLVFLSGCGDTYSEAIQYTVRVDPVFAKPAELVEERPEPDRPGQFPLYSIVDLQDVRNPLNARADDLLKNGIIRDPGKLSDKEREKLDDVLTALFGTPAAPEVNGVSKAVRETLKLDADTLERGSRLYRHHCLQCHGVTGDGRGPTARWVNPHPRDYRQGLFKFQSVDQTQKSDRKPRRADLVRVIQDGVEGTAMPAHNLLPPRDLEDLASYVIHLSIRGQAEFETLTQVFTPDMVVNKADHPEGPERYLRSAVARIGKAWLDAQSPSAIITPAPYPQYTDAQMAESVQRGQKTFLAAGGGGAQASCVSCHKDYGRESLFRYDAWGTLVRPTNLTAGVYRGGRRPVDLYWRIHSGINGSGMAAFGSSLQGDQIWDVVNFLRALPYPAMRAKYGIEVN